MSRIALAASILVTALAFGCTKAPANQEGTASPPGGGETGGVGKIVVPGGGNDMGAVRGGPEATGAEGDSRSNLTAEEGKITILAPADAKANAETIAKVTITAGSAYKVNTEFPTKLTLKDTSGVTFVKQELKAGGHDKAKGDADVFDEKELVFAVKLTPSASGSYTINGTFKFAVCDKAGSTCLPKKAPIAIQVAAK